MIESGRVVAIETDALWVETQQQTTCGKCSAQKGCGQGLLQQLHPARPNHLRVLLANNDEAQPYVVGEKVEFSLPDHIIVAGSVLLYLVPIMGLLLGSLLGGQLFANELAVIASAFVGFCIAATGVRLFSVARTDDATFHAQLIGRVRKSPISAPLQLKMNAI